MKEALDGAVEQGLAFDHAKILKDCTKRLGNKVLYTSLPIQLMPAEFTLYEFQPVYEIILESKVDHKSFRRRILNADILEETGTMKQTGHRPAINPRCSTDRKSDETFFFVRNIESSHEN